jgi:hypothetical protein
MESPSVYGGEDVKRVFLYGSRTKGVLGVRRTIVRRTGFRRERPIAPGKKRENKEKRLAKQREKHKIII